MARRAVQTGEGARPLLDEEVALRKIVEGVEAETGEGFFRSLVRCVTEALDVSYAFVSELAAERRVFRTLAVWGHGELLGNFELPLAGTPCEGVLSGQPAHYPDRIQERFPSDAGLKTWEAQSYCGTPLIDSGGRVLGHLAIFDTRPMRDPRGLAILRIFASRARAELERKRFEEMLVRNESRFRDLYEEAPLAYLTVDVSGVIRRTNGRIFELLGYPPEAVIGRAPLDFVPDTPNGKALVEHLYKRFLLGEVIDDVEVEAHRADGQVAWLSVSFRPLRDEAGNLTAARTALVDVTERKVAQEKLRQSELRYRDLYEEAPVAYWYATAEGRIDNANRTMAELLGVPRERIVGRTLYDFAADTPHGKPVTLELRRRFLAGEDVHGDEVECRRSDGSPVWIRVSVNSVRDSQGRPIGGRVTAVDVTANKRAEDAMRVSEYLEEEIRAEHNVDEIIGSSPALLAMLEKVRLVAPTDSSVLLLGETGTGKELIARAVHSGSRRRNRPLIKVNCAALPTGLIESELFGHEKGAFTGASDRRIGRFELADGGTIFLDEIGEVPAEVQVKLLRVLQEREIERVGGNKTMPVDVRVIAATNRDLKAAAAAGTFRQDLFYRLNVFPVEVPSLRERPQDVPLLVHYFVARCGAKIGRRIRTVPAESMRRLLAYSWPGNVRELEHVIERAVILSPGTELTGVPELESVAAPPRPPSSTNVASQPSPPRDEMPAVALDEVERSHIVSILKQSGWRIEGPLGAARLLDMNPSTLRSRMKKLGISRSLDEFS